MPMPTCPVCGRKLVGSSLVGTLAVDPNGHLVRLTADDPCRVCLTGAGFRPFRARSTTDA